MNENFPKGERDEENVDLSRRNFLKNSVLAAAGLVGGSMIATADAEVGAAENVLSGPELEARIDGIAREIEQRETILNELLKLTDADIEAINNGVFTRDSVVFVEQRVSDTTEEDQKWLLPQEKFTTSEGALVGGGVGALMGAGMAAVGNSDAEISDDEFKADMKKTAKIAAVVGAVAGGYMGNENDKAAFERTRVEYSGILSPVLSRYREGGTPITRSLIAEEVKEQGSAIEFLRRQRTRHKKMRGDKDVDEPGRFYKSL